jgi:hypothetical protein
LRPSPTLARNNFGSNDALDLVAIFGSFSGTLIAHRLVRVAAKELPSKRRATAAIADV